MGWQEAKRGVALYVTNIADSQKLDLMIQTDWSHMYQELFPSGLIFPCTIVLIVLKMLYNKKEQVSFPSFQAIFPGRKECRTNFIN